MINCNLYKQIRLSLCFALIIAVFLLLDISQIITEKNHVIVAVIDTGLDLKQFKFKLIVVQGFNVINQDSLPQDDNGHGTKVTSIINNLEPKLKIMPIKVVPKSGLTEKSYLAKGIIWAVDNGAKIINISAGVISPNVELKKAIEYAESKDVLVISATGNDGHEDIVHYPAAFSTVLAVGSADINDNKLNNSNWGYQIDVVALGSNVPAITLRGNKEYVSGTSASAAIVTALAGRIIIDNPELKPCDVRNMIRSLAVDIDNKGWNKNTGYGLIKYDKRYNFKKSTNTNNYPKQIPIEKTFNDLVLNNGKYILEMPFKTDLELDIKCFPNCDFNINLYNIAKNTQIVNGMKYLNKIKLIENLEKGQYLLEVFTKKNDKTYDASITAKLKMHPDSCEPNNTIKSATELNGITSMICNFNNCDDVDWFKIDCIKDKDLIEVYVKSDFTQIDPIIILKKENGDFLEIDNTASKNTEIVKLKMQKSKTYYIGIKNAIDLDACGEYAITLKSY